MVGWARLAGPNPLADEFLPIPKPRGALQELIRRDFQAVAELEEISKRGKRSCSW